MYSRGYTPLQMKAYRIGKVAEETKLSADTLRYYERIGLIPKASRGANGYREYPPETIDRVKLIQSALALGFTLRELQQILRTRDKGGIPCKEVRLLAADKLSQVETRIRSLKTARKLLQRVIRAWDEKLSNTTPGTRAGLLETLGPVPVSSELKHEVKRRKEK